MGLSYIYCTDLEQLVSAAKVLVQMQNKRVLALSVCLIVAAKTEWGYSRKRNGPFGLDGTLKASTS